MFEKKPNRYDRLSTQQSGSKGKISHKSNTFAVGFLFVIDHGYLVSSSKYEPKICFDMSKYSPSYLQGPVSLTPVAERLAMKLFLPVLAA